jgi:hypothetical protein
MKLWEYVLKYDKRSSGTKGMCDNEIINGKIIKFEKGLDYELFLKRDYCPGVFECFVGTEFEKPMYPSKKENRCKAGEHEPFNLDEDYHGSYEEMKKAFDRTHKKCVECWDREIIDENDEYKMYLKLKEKYEGENHDSTRSN